MPRYVTRAEPARILSEADCRAIYDRVRGFVRGRGETFVAVSGWWQGELRWARNRVSLASDRRNIQVVIARGISQGGFAPVITNQTDDASLEAAVRAAERIADRSNWTHGRNLGFEPPWPDDKPVPTAIWSDATFDLTTEARSAVAAKLTEAAEAAGMSSAGYLETRVGALMVLGVAHPSLKRAYTRWTQAQCSLTVRDTSGRGSGWAALSSHDWSRIDGQKLGEIAIDKCRASRNPVAIEPGRYVVILEPQAVADLMEPVVRSFANREFAETPSGIMSNPWFLANDDALGVTRSKLGLKVMDERLTISHDPRDPQLGIVMTTLEYPGPVTWIDKGVLTELGRMWETDVQSLRSHYQLRGGTGYRVSGGETSLAEMIRSTRRGLVVTRLSNLRTMQSASLLSSGLTRDGLWLVENGKITKAVKNLRFTESPLFALNSIEQLGEPVPVFRPTIAEGGDLTPAIVPPLKIRDFSFTSAIDAF